MPYFGGPYAIFSVEIFMPYGTPIVWHHYLFLGGRFGYFLFFSARGGGRGSPRRREGVGGRFLLKIPGAGGVSGGGGPEGPGGCLRRIGDFGGGGDLNIFFRGRNVHQVLRC